jgi:hypothetical protein
MDDIRRMTNDELATALDDQDALLALMEPADSPYTPAEIVNATTRFLALMEPADSPYTPAEIVTATTRFLALMTEFMRRFRMGGGG